MNRVVIDPERCVHCQDCIAVCPVGVYAFIGKRVRVVDPGSCLGVTCQMCQDGCWKMATTITPESGAMSASRSSPAAT